MRRDPSGAPALAPGQTRRRRASADLRLAKANQTCPIRSRSSTRRAAAGLTNRAAHPVAALGEPRQHSSGVGRIVQDEDSTAQSSALSSIGSTSSSPKRKSTLAAAAARSRAGPAWPVGASTAMARPTCGARAAVTCPVPQPRSPTCHPSSEGQAVPSRRPDRRRAPHEAGPIRHRQPIPQRRRGTWHVSAR